MSNIPPFLQGQAAYRRGDPLSSNPHTPRETLTGDAYPGPWACWNDGWLHQRAVDRHTAKMAEKKG
jgi:hypothetical protein